MGFIFVVGGVRSGKSRFAEELAGRIGDDVLYVATAGTTTPQGTIDEEMTRRIARHRARRPAGWVTLEEPLDVAGAVKKWLKRHGLPDVVLVDCLTLLLSNWLLNAGEGQSAEADVMARVDELTAFLTEMPCPAIVVSNETGAGIVPTSALGRAFRDLSGMANQQMAARAKEVYVTIAGIPVNIKKLDARLKWRDGP